MKAYIKKAILQCGLRKNEQKDRVKNSPEHDENIRDMVHPFSVNISKLFVGGRHE